MRGTAEAQGLLWATDALCGDLLEEEGFLLTLSKAMGSVFTDDDFDPLYPSRRGRPSHPPCVLAALLLAQVFYNVSDREAERRSRVDLSWKAALGLPLDHRGIPHVCLAEFRARLLKAGMEGFLQDRLMTIAQQAGVLGRRRVVDSTGIADSVMTQDTVTLIRQAVRRCLSVLTKIDPVKAASTTAGLIRDDYQREGKPQILWSDPAARAELLQQLFTDAQTVIEACDQDDDPDLRSACDLLGQVAGQDLEKDEEPGSQVRLRQGVAADRIISTVDPDARHGHRSRSDRYDGYKLHLSADIDSDLITAAEATRATEMDSTALPYLLDADPTTVQEVIADTAYGDGSTRQAMVERKVELVAPAPPCPAKPGFFSKAEFSIDPTAGTATCPAGHTITARRHSKRRNASAHLQFRFPQQTCERCPLRASCTSSPKGRVVTIGPHEALLQQARAARSTAEFRDRYRQRAQIERKAAQVKFRRPKIPWRGLARVRAWVRLRVAALNLRRLGVLNVLGSS